MNYSELTDEELVARAQAQDTEAMDCLFKRYQNFVRAKVKGYYLEGGDRDDVFQEGMMGLFRAVKCYLPERQTSFRAFAALCIHGQIVTAINAYRSNKHIPINQSVSLDKVIYDDGSERTLLDVLPDNSSDSNPETVMAERESIDRIMETMDTVLTPLEREVMKKYMEGKSYKQISEETGWHFKRVDNALQRVKKKLRSVYDGEE